MGTKGTWRRPAQISDKELEDRWAAWFGKVVPGPVAPTPEDATFRAEPFVMAPEADNR